MPRLGKPYYNYRSETGLVQVSTPANIEGRLKLRQLALVVAIHDLGTLGKASQALCITQPAATHALKELELQLGAPLFERSKSGMVATMFGRLLVERSRRMLTNIRSTAEEIAQLKDGESGEVRIGALPAQALTVVPEAIAICRERRPKVILDLVEGSLGQLLPALANGDLDLVVGRIPLSQIANGFRHEVLGSEQHAVICRAGHALTRKRKVTLADIAGQDWILPAEGSHVRSQFHEAFVNAGIVPPEPVLVTSSTTARMTLVATTDMLAVLASGAARILRDRGIVEILEVGINVRQTPISIMTRSDAVLTPATNHFVEFLREVMRNSEPKAALRRRKASRRGPTAPILVS